MFGNGIGTRARTCSCTLWRAATVFIGDRGADMSFAPPSESRNTAVGLAEECHTRPNLTGFLSKIISLFARNGLDLARKLAKVGFNESFSDDEPTLAT